MQFENILPIRIYIQRQFHNMVEIVSAVKDPLIRVLTKRQKMSSIADEATLIPKHEIQNLLLTKVRTIDNLIYWQKIPPSHQIINGVSLPKI